MDEARFASLIERMDDRFAEHGKQMDARFAQLGQQIDERDERFIQRMSRSEQHFIEALADNTAELKQISERQAVISRSFTESIREVGESINDMRASIVANTQAVLSVIDRLDDLGGGTA